MNDVSKFHLSSQVSWTMLAALSDLYSQWQSRDECLLGWHCRYIADFKADFISWRAKHWITGLTIITVSSRGPELIEVIVNGFHVLRKVLDYFSVCRCSPLTQTILPWGPQSGRRHRLPWLWQGWRGASLWLQEPPYIPWASCWSSDPGVWSQWRRMKTSRMNVIQTKMASYALEAPFSMCGLARWSASG